MGTRVTRAAHHLALEQIKEQMKQESRGWLRQRWWIIYQAAVEPRRASEIARQTGVSVSTVSRVVASYNRRGEVATQTPGTGERRRAYLTLTQERAFLAPFVARAAQGEIATARQIQHALENDFSDPPLGRYRDDDSVPLPCGYDVRRLLYCHASGSG